MNDPILSRQAIAADADAAAARFVKYRVEQQNPHEPGTEAHAVWAAAFARYVTEHAVPGCEASA